MRLSEEWIEWYRGANSSCSRFDLLVLLDLLLEAGCDGDADDGEHEAGEEDDALVVRDPFDVEAQQGAAGDQVHGDAEPVKKQK